MKIKELDKYSKRMLYYVTKQLKIKVRYNKKPIKDAEGGYHIGGNTIYLNRDKIPDNETFQHVLAHECGHALDTTLDEDTFVYHRDRRKEHVESHDWIIDSEVRAWRSASKIFKMFDLKLNKDRVNKWIGTYGGKYEEENN